MKAVKVIKFSLSRMCCFMVCLVMFNISIFLLASAYIIIIPYKKKREYKIIHLAGLAGE